MTQLKGRPSAGQRGEVTSGVRQGSLRRANLRLLLSLAYAAASPLSRADLAGLSGLTRSTASRLVDELVGAGLLTEGEPSRTASPGRPATPLLPGEAALAAVGIEVSTSYVAVRLIGLSGTVLGERHRFADLVDSDPAEVFALAGDLTAGLREEFGAGSSLRLLGAGLALPGLVDRGTGTLLTAPNLVWPQAGPDHPLDPAPLLGPALADLPLQVGNEADLAALAVAHDRPGHLGEHRDFLFVSADVGIGGSIVTGGEPLTGRHGWAGELGHICIDPNGPRCRCGATGCLERYAGRDVVFDAAGRPDPMRLRQAGRALGIAIAGAVNLLDVPTVVIGGDLAEVLDELLPELEPQLTQRVLAASVRPVRIVAAPADRLAATGAAYRVLHHVLADPSLLIDPRTSPGSALRRRSGRDRAEPPRRR